MLINLNKTRSFFIKIKSTKELFLITTAEQLLELFKTREFTYPDIKELNYVTYKVGRVYNGKKGFINWFNHHTELYEDYLKKF